jgi:hypothetical protein
MGEVWGSRRGYSAAYHPAGHPAARLQDRRVSSAVVRWRPYSLVNALSGSAVVR